MERLLALAPWPEGRGVLASSGSGAGGDRPEDGRLLGLGEAGDSWPSKGGYHGADVWGRWGHPPDGLPGAVPGNRLYPGVAWAPFPLPGPRGAGAGPRAAGGGAAHPGPGHRRNGRWPFRGGAGGEPIQGRRGVRVPPPGSSRGLARRLARRGARCSILRRDLFTGFGRTGSLFAFSTTGFVFRTCSAWGRRWVAGMPLLRLPGLTEGDGRLAPLPG